MKILVLVVVLALMWLFALGIYCLIKVQDQRKWEKSVDQLMGYMNGSN